MYNIFTNERCTYIVVYNEDSWFFVIGLAIMVCWCNYVIIGRQLAQYTLIPLQMEGLGFYPLIPLQMVGLGFYPLTSLSPPSLLLNPPSPLSTQDLMNHQKIQLLLPDVENLDMDDK